MVHFLIMALRKRYRHLICSLKGRHQIENAALAIGVIESIAMKGFEVKDDAVFAGIRDVRWEGAHGDPSACPNGSRGWCS